MKTTRVTRGFRARSCARCTTPKPGWGSTYARVVEAVLVYEYHEDRQHHHGIAGPAGTAQLDALTLLLGLRHHSAKYEGSLYHCNISTRYTNLHLISATITNIICFTRCCPRPRPTPRLRVTSPPTPHPTPPPLLPRPRRPVPACLPRAVLRSKLRSA